ncbi:MAG: hypothetical protein ACLGIN_05425 [Candidatus Sericytochromatia bacterium]
MRGLPIGEGQVWRDPAMRRWLVLLAAVAMAPFFALLLPATGLMGYGTYDAWIVAPALGMIAAGAWITYRRHRPLFHRLAVGFGAGWASVLAYDLFHLLIAADGSFGAGLPVWSGVGRFASEGAWIPAYFHHWITMGALWGAAYALVAGKARWLWGVVFGLAMWANAVTFSLFLPFGGPFVPGAGPAAMTMLLIGTLIFGTVLGLLNARFQPVDRYHGKIVFLRDYQARVRSRR